MRWVNLYVRAVSEMETFNDFKLGMLKKKLPPLLCMYLEIGSK